MDEHFRKLEHMYLRAHINTQMYESTTVRIDSGRADIGLTIEEKYFHALGAIHGSVYFKLLDDACFFAVNSLVTDVFVLTTSFNINIIRPVSSGTVKATGKVRFRSRELFIAEAHLVNEKGKEVAFGTGHFARSKVGLNKEIGYR